MLTNSTSKDGEQAKWEYAKEQKGTEKKREGEAWY